LFKTKETKDVGVNTESNALSQSMDIGVTAVPNTTEIGINTSLLKTKDISISAIPDTKNICISPIKATEVKSILIEKGTSPIVSGNVFEISPIKPILPILPVSDKDNEVKIDNISNISEDTRSYPNAEELNLIFNPLKHEIETWQSKHKLSIVIPSSEDNKSEYIQSVRDSLFTKISHLELESLSASSSVINARIALIEKLVASGVNIDNIPESLQQSDVIVLSNVGSSIPSIPIIVVSQPNETTNVVSMPTAEGEVMVTPDTNIVETIIDVIS
jgi:hypothetical protein